MLTLQLGLGTNLSAGVQPSAQILFADGVPTGLTETASDTVRTYRDSSGELQQVAASTPIIDHDVDGNIIGLQCFPARSNVCTNTNYGAVAATTNMTLTDLGTGATLTTSTDTVYIPLFKIGNVVSRVYQLYGGDSGAECEISGNIGATGACSASVVARVLQSGRTCYLGHTQDKTNTVFSNYPEYALVKAENMTAAATTDKLVIKIPAFTAVRFILNQFEVGAKASPTLLVSGSSATSVKNFNQMPVPDGFDINQGAIVMEVQALLDTGNANAAGLVIVGSSEDNFPDDAYYIQSNQSSNLANAYAKGNNSTLNIAAASAFISNRHHPVGMIYQNAGAVRSFAGAMVTTNTTITMPDTAADIDTITFGAFAANTWQFNGWIKSIKFFSGAVTMRQLAKFALGSKTGNTERGIVFGGQSNAEGFFSAATVLTNGGERAIVEELDTVLGTSTRNWGINGATGGSSLTGWQGTGAFIEKAKQIYGNYLAAGGSIEALVWDQGESNMGNTIAWWEDNTLEVLEDIMAFTGISKAYIQQGGFYLLNDTDTHKENCYKWKQGHANIAASDSRIKLLPPKIIHPLYDTVHLTDAGYTTQGHIITRFILDDLGYTVTGGVVGPSITGVSRSGTTVTVTITHGDGTDFTIGGPDGWEFLDDGVRIEVTAAVRTNATTITLTLDSAPSGEEKLRYGMGSGYDHSGVAESPANYVRDNSTPRNLPLFIGEFDVS